MYHPSKQSTPAAVHSQSDSTKAVLARTLSAFEQTQASGLKIGSELFQPFRWASSCAVALARTISSSQPLPFLIFWVAVQEHG